ncbi:hypothetical protein [Streptomyces sp. NPDC044948]|uniref:hypothetical protein n=1 Tax=Streptomyces sp. NPDC044948 TaxID=3157092 RepID=UPI0033CA600C
MIAAAAVIALGGLTAIVYGILRADLPRALGGAALTMPALTFIALVFVRRWVTDTRDERQRLAAAQRYAEGERTRYLAAQAALTNEAGRNSREMHAERVRLQAQLTAEREAMRVEFEEQKATLVCETMEATVRMFHNGKFAPGTTTRGKLIRLTDRLPAQGHAADAAQERSHQRERGHAGS